MNARPGGFWRIVALGGIAILAFDVAGSTLSKATGFPYAWLSIGSWFIQGYAGYRAARALGRGAGIGAGALVALIEATIGWWLSALIGPGQPQSASPAVLVISVLIVTALGALAGLIGALIAGRRGMSNREHR